MVKKVLLLEPIGGISGDMTVAALLALGASLDAMRDGLAAIGLTEVTLETEPTQRHNLQATRFMVRHRDGHAPDTHAHAHPHQHKHSHGEDEHHHNEHHPGEGEVHASHAHRSWREIRAMLEGGTLSSGAKEIALRIFKELARAEGEVHGMETEAVTFHEVGAWDSIADIVCAAVALDELSPDAVFCTPVPVGCGTVTTAHGVMPIPTPATLLLLRGFPTRQGGPAYERTTPTGAAILAALARPAPDDFVFTPDRVGLGAGTRDEATIPNILRATLGRMDANEGRDEVGLGGLGSTDVVEMAEANVDDANPEWIGHLMERLFEDGALDVSLIPVHMKKNRPGTLIQVLYAPNLRGRITARLFSEVTTLGVRYRSLERTVVEREAVTVSTSWGEVAGKVARHRDAVRFAPEYESCREVALREGIPLRDVYRAAQAAWDERTP